MFFWIINLGYKRNFWEQCRDIRSIFAYENNGKSGPFHYIAALAGVILNFFVNTRNAIINKGGEKTYKLITLFLVPVILILIVYKYTSSERIIFPFLSAEFGLPVAHFTKIFVCYFIIQTRYKLFEGDLLAHTLFWGYLAILSVVTSDFGSLLFSIVSYPVASWFLRGNIPLPDPFRVKGWWHFYRRKQADTGIPEYPLLTGRKFFLKVFLPLIVFLLILAVRGDSFLPDKVQGKVHRFTLPYIPLESETYRKLNNRHKESQAKMIWYLDNHWHGNTPEGEGTTLRTRNFYTTWHTDHAFLTGLQFGGFIFLGIFLLLIFYLLYDTIFFCKGIGSLLSHEKFDRLQWFAQNTVDDAKRKQSTWIKAFLTRHIFLFFLTVYLLVQTIYPALACLNLVPLTGQAIPCLSVSIVESLLTPLLLAIIYLSAGRMLHNNESFFSKPIEHTDPSEYNKHIIRSNPTAAWQLSLLVAGVLIFAVFVKGFLIDKKQYYKDHYTLVHYGSPGEIMQLLLDNLNNQNTGKEPDKAELLHSVNELVNNQTTTLEEKKYLIEKAKKFILFGNKANYGLEGALVLENGKFDFKIEKPNIRELYRDNVMADFTYDYYFRERGSNSFGNATLGNPQKIYLDRNTVFIENDSLRLNGVEIGWLRKAKRPKDKLVYNSDTAYVYKQVNNLRRLIPIYETLGDVNYRSNTIDRNLHALINVYLGLFVRNNGDQFKAASVIIADNNSGEIRVASAYPCYPNASDSLKEKEKQKFVKGGFLSYIPNGEGEPFNFGFADGMPGSAIKPITAAGALIADGGIASRFYNDLDKGQEISFTHFIARSSNGYAAALLRDFYNRPDYKESMHHLFGIRVTEDVKVAPDFTAQSGAVLFPEMLLLGNATLADRNGLSKSLVGGAGNPFYATGIGQGDAITSLAFLVQCYARIRTQKALGLRFFRSPKPSGFPSLGVPPNAWDSLYQGMQMVLTSTLGTAHGTVGKVMEDLRLNRSLYLAKTGTVQIGDVNKSATIVIAGPGYTIGVNLLGNLQNRNQDSHAKKILSDLLPLLKQWRGGIYLQ